jgi:BASS family bile acid:Na+ symporter
MGLLLPQASVCTRHLTLPALAVVMSISTMGISRDSFPSPRSLVIPAIFGVLMCYGVLGGFIIGVSALAIHDKELWNGFIVLAIMPPAVAVIPFTDLFRGNNAFSLAGTVGGYLGALVIMPLVLYNFLESSRFALERLSIAAIVLIIVPLIVSRILRWKKIDKDLEDVKGTITNWSFFVVVYSIVGLNQDIFTQQPLMLLPVAAIAVGSMFVLGLVIEWIGKLFRIDPQTTMSLVLLGTIKNYGLAAGIALSLFSKESALPATVSTIFMFIYVIWIGFKQRWTGDNTPHTIPQK